MKGNTDRMFLHDINFEYIVLAGHLEICSKRTLVEILSC